MEHKNIKHFQHLKYMYDKLQYWHNISLSLYTSLSESVTSSQSCPAMRSAFQSDTNSNVRLLDTENARLQDIHMGRLYYWTREVRVFLIKKGRITI